MAVILVLIGGLCGFFAAVLALFSLNIGWFQAFEIWTITGLSTADLLLRQTLAAPRNNRRLHRSEIA